MSSLLDEVRTARRLPPPSMRRAIRQAAGVSQQRIADELGVDRVTVTRWESGQRQPRGALAARYVELLEGLREACAA